ncbi:MAG: addiction module antitoxin RelB [Phenylobacterium sp.]|nr:addiction module antitoxin RelB [Phenylobacterium sp.]
MPNSGTAGPPPRSPHVSTGCASAIRVSEMRIDSGPGYRLYFRRRGADVVILLCGGDKSTQDQDIERAKDLARKLEA